MSSTEKPGAHVRHLLRRQNNPLFPAARREVDATALAAAQQRDEAERTTFIEYFRELLQQALALKPNEESEVLLQLKGRMDEAYTRCASLGGDLTPFKQGLARITATIMAGIRQGAGGDPQAQQELDQEQLARESHYRLLEHVLVADLMRPESPIGDDELVPALLNAGSEELDAALWLFDAEQLGELCAQARGLLEACPTAPAQATENLARMERLLAVEASADTVN